MSLLQPAEACPIRHLRVSISSANKKEMGPYRGWRTYPVACSQAG